MRRELAEMENLTQSRGVLVQLALALATLTNARHILDRALEILVAGYPGTRWAILDRINSKDYRSTSEGIGAYELRRLLKLHCTGETKLKVQEMKVLVSGLGDPMLHAGYNTNFGEPYPHIVVGVWGEKECIQPSFLPINEICLLIDGACRKASELEWLRNRCSVDELTGLPNRRGILELLEREETRVKRYGGKLSVLFVDLNYFKSINDTYGHQVGDKALRLAATELDNVLRASDSLGRLGGDEFLVILPGVDFEEAMLVAGRMERALESVRCEVDNDSIFLSASIGASCIGEGVFGSELVDKADERMYVRKRNYQRAKSLLNLDKSIQVAGRLAAHGRAN